MEIRQKMQEDIFVILTKRINRDNKNQYCDEHAMVRAKRIENSLYRNCCKLNSDWEKLYSELDIENLINNIEEKTMKCIYRTPSRTIMHI